MKKLFFTFALSFLVMGAFAQKKVLKDAQKAFRKGEMESAIELATQATQDAETGAEADVYLLLGDIYKEKYVQDGKTDAELAKTSYEWYQKAIEKGGNKVKEDLMKEAVVNPQDPTKTLGGGGLGQLEAFLLDRGNKALEEEDYETAYQLLRVATMIRTEIAKDFFVGYAAQNAEADDVAYEYYKKVIAYDEEYENKNYAYNMVIQHQMENEMFDEALASIRAAQKAFPEDDIYRQWEVDVLIQTKKMDEAIENLKKLIEGGNAEKNIYYMLAYLQWNNDNLDDAEKNAKKALELDPNYAEALYVAASVIYNKGAAFMTEANSTMDDDAKYKELKDKALAKFKEAMPMFEKAVAADPNDVYSLRPLSTIYDQLGMDAKRDEILDRLEKLEGGN